MPHTEAIRREIARLESKANDIEKEAIQLVNEINIQNRHRKQQFTNKINVVYVFAPDNSQEVRLRKLSANYEAWYNSADELVRKHLPNRLTDFEQFYKFHSAMNGNQGLFYDIRLSKDYETPEGKSEAITFIKAKFDHQRNIVNSIPDVVDARSLDLLTVISGDLVNSEIDHAEHIFKKDKTHDYCLRVAGILAGIALERHLKTRCESEIGSLPNDPTLGPLIDALYKAGKLTLNQKKYLEAIATTRNDCAHATATVNRTMVGEAISNVKKFLEGNL